MFALLRTLALALLVAVAGQAPAQILPGILAAPVAAAATDCSSFANLVAWYRLGVGLTNDGAGLISKWADQSGAGNDLNATTTKRPTLQGDNSLLFNGTGNVMASSNFTLNQPYSVFILFKQVTWTYQDYILDGNSGDNGALVQYPTASSPSLIMYAGGALTVATTDLALNTYGAVGLVFNGASSKMQVDSHAQVTGSPGTANAGGITLGSYGNKSTQFANMQVKEMCVYTGAKSDADIQSIIDYLNTL